MASPTAGSAPLAVTFNTSPPFSEAPSPTTWLFSRWDFGDGQTAITAQATHTYTVPGTYIASAYYAFLIGGWLQQRSYCSRLGYHHRHYAQGHRQLISHAVNGGHVGRQYSYSRTV